MEFNEKLFQGPRTNCIQGVQGNWSQGELDYQKLVEIASGEKHTQSVNGWSVLSGSEYWLVEKHLAWIVFCQKHFWSQPFWTEHSCTNNDLDRKHLKKKSRPNLFWPDMTWSIKNPDQIRFDHIWYGQLKFQTKRVLTKPHMANKKSRPNAFWPSRIWPTKNLDQTRFDQAVCGQPKIQTKRVFDHVWFGHVWFLPNRFSVIWFRTYNEWVQILSLRNMYGANQFVAKCYQCQILTEQLCTVHLVSQPDTIFANYLQTNHLRTGCVFRLMLSPPTSDNR